MSWKKYGGTDTFDKTSDLRLNSLTTNYFTILKQITNDVDISGNLNVKNRLDVYGDVSFNQNLNVEGNIIVNNDLDVFGNSRIYNNQYIDGNLTVLDHLYFQDVAENIYMYGTDFGIAINKENPEADVDIFGNRPYTLNVKSSNINSNNILCRNVNDQGIMLSVDANNATIGYFFDNSLNIGNIGDYPDAYIQYNSGGELHIEAKDHVQIVADLIVTDVSSNHVNDSIITVYNDKNNRSFLYDIYDVSSVYSGTAICGVARDSSSNISINLVSKYTELGGALYGGAYPKDLTRGMLSIGTTDFSNHTYAPAQTIVSGASNVVYKNTTGINRAIPKVDQYALDVNGGIRIDNNDITISAHIPFDIGSMRFSRQYPNSGIVIGGPYEFDPQDNLLKVYSQNAYITTDVGSSWTNSSIAYRQSNIGSSVFMRASWVYDDKFMIAYGDTGKGYSIDVSNNTWYDKNMLTQSNESTKNVIDIFACDFSGNRANKNALAKVFFIMYNANSYDPAYQLRYFNAAFGENTLAYSGNTNYVSYYQNSTPIADNTSPLTYYRLDNITGKCIDGAGYLSGTDCSSVYIYIAGNNIRKYLFSGISDVTEIANCSHNVSSGSTSVYNAISVVDMSNVFVVGNGFISHTVDGGDVWSDISRNTANLTIEDVVLKSVWAYDVSNAVAVGSGGAVVYTTNGYTWKNAPEQLFDLSGTGFELVDASLNNVFLLNKNDFIVSINNSTFDMSPDVSNIGYGTVIYNHVPDLLNSTNNSVLDLCGNMTIAGNIIIDKPSGNICSTGNNLYIASNTPNIYIGDGTAQNIYLGNNDANSLISVSSQVDFDASLNLNGGLTVTNGNILINADNYLVSNGIDVSYCKIDVVNINGGNASSRIHNGHDVSYALHVNGYRPAVRFDASLSVDQLYVDSSAVLSGRVKSTYINSTNFGGDPALSVAGYSNFGSAIAVDGSNGRITLSNKINAVSNFDDSLYGGLYLANGTGAFIDGNVFIGRSVIIFGGESLNSLVVENGTTGLKNTSISGTLNVTENVSLSSDLTVSSYSHLLNKVDISGNVDLSGNLRVQSNIYGYNDFYVNGLSHFYSKVDISGNLDVSGNVDVSGNINAYYINCNTVYQGSDYRIKTGVKSLVDTSFNVDKIIPKYYFNTRANKNQIGFIAHELQEEYPFLVSGVKDGPEIQGVDYLGLIGVLVKEIQDLKTRVSILENYMG
jgi:cytoskeletal protein CcmA (bactofilin family)